MDSYLHDTIVHAIHARTHSRNEACKVNNYSIYDDMPNALNTVDIEMFESFESRTIRLNSPRDRKNDSPMLRQIKNRMHFPSLLNDMNLGGKWAEVGVYRGEFSKHLLDEGKPEMLVLVDLWDAVDIYDAEESKHNLAEMIENVKDYANNVEVVKGFSHLVPLEYADNDFDFVYIDATHSYEDSKQDIEAWWPKVKIGGLIGGDDYHNGFTYDHIYSFGVKDAVDEFFAKKNHRVYVTYELTEGQSLTNWYVIKCSE